MTLSKVRAPRRVRLAGLADEVAWLDSLGFLPGSAVLVLTNTRVGVTLRLAGVTYALGRRTAGAIRVE